MIPNNAPRNTYWPKVDGKVDNNWLMEELKEQRAKLAWREFEASNLIPLDMILQVRDQNGHTITGRLQKNDPRSASIVIANTLLSPKSVAIAKRIPYPEALQHREPLAENLKQSYFGHKLIVAFRVLSIPKGYENFLR